MNFPLCLIAPTDRQAIFKIPHSRITKRYRETLVACLCHMSQKAVSTICLGCWITVLRIDGGPWLFCEMSAMVSSCMTDPPG